MKLIYITGVEGSGKSSISDELQNRGYRSIDLDESKLTRRYHRDSWELSPLLPQAGDSTSEWFQTHEWKVKPFQIRKESLKYEDRIIFFCGITDNFNDIKEEFDYIFCLYLDPFQVKERLAGRGNNSFGKKPVEQNYILNKQEEYQQEAKRSGAVMLNGARFLKDIVDEIVSLSVM